jgi:2-aminobenzoate-CoA ligase
MPRINREIIEKGKEYWAMSQVPPEFLPPEKYLPETVQLLPELVYPEKFNLTEVLLDWNLPKRADKTAIYYEDKKISYAELQAKVNRFANALRELGVEKNDRILLRSPNIPEYVIWNFACWRIGAIPVLVNHLNRHEEVAFKANDSVALAACVHADFYEDLAKVLHLCPTLKHVIVTGKSIPGTLNFEDLLGGQSAEASSEICSRKDYARLIYSSGTTGKPKGILTTLEGVLSGIDTHGRHILKIREEDILGGHPYFTFAFGSVNFTMEPWRFGSSISIITRFRPEDQWQLVEKHGISLLFAVPTAFNMMLGVEEAEKKYDLRSMRLCQSAGEWLPASTSKEWKQRFGVPIIDSLGSGDLMYHLSTFEGMDGNKAGSTGISVPGFQNLIVDDNFKEVPRGVMGELIVRGPVGQTYWRRPDKQQEGVCPPESAFKGWSRPGICYMQDEDGYFWYKGRSDDMIVTAGYKIPGGEVEGSLNNHPAVLESAVVDTPDKDRGNVIKAFVVLKKGYDESEELVRELQDFVKKEIEPYKYPRIIEFSKADDLPRTATGKIQRNILRDREHGRVG